jgi:sulfonate transport system permease protein
MTAFLYSTADSQQSPSLDRIRPARSTRHSLPRSIRRLTGPFLLLALWSIASSRGWISSDFLPSPATLVATFRELVQNGDLIEALTISLQRVIIGFAIGAAIGTGFALISGLFLIGEDLVDAPVQMIRTMPWAGLIPLLIVWLGIDEEPKIALVALAVFFPIYINVFAGIRNVDQSLVEVGRVLGLRRSGLIRHVIIPGALPSALVGLRYALGAAWLALVFAEQVNSQAGLGYLITHAREIYRTDIIIVCLAIYALLGLGADSIVRFLERRLLIWRPTFNGA